MKTEAEIQELIERRAKLYAANIHSEYIPEYTARDFLAGVTLGREIECEQVRELIEVTGDLTTAYLSGLKPLQSQIQRAFDVLRSLESLAKYQSARDFERR